MNRAETAGKGIGFGGLLTVLFIGLKLTGHIAWPWIWVVSPLWIPIALLVALVIIFGIFAIIGVATQVRKGR